MSYEEDDFKEIDHFSKEDQEKIKAARVKVRECINMLKDRYPNDSMVEDLIKRIEPRHIKTQAGFETIINDFFQEMEADMRLRREELRAFWPKEVTFFGQNIKNAINVLRK